MADVNLRRIQPRAEFARTAHQIGVNVGFENVRYRDAVLARHVDVNVTVRAGIENRSDSFVVITDEIGKLGDAGRLDCLENERHPES